MQWEGWCTVPAPKSKDSLALPPCPEGPIAYNRNKSRQIAALSLLLPAVRDKPTHTASRKGGTSGNIQRKCCRCAVQQTLAAKAQHREESEFGWWKIQRPSHLIEKDCCENVAGMQCGRPWLGKHSIGRKVSLGGGRFRGRVI